MPQIAPNYEENPEIIRIADQLIDLYPELFGQTDLSRISAFSITNKDRKDNTKPIWEIAPIKPPVSIVANKDYIISVYLDSYEQLSEKHKAALVADVLCSIPAEGKGKLNPKDVKEHGAMIRTLGVDFMSNEIPDIINDNVEWVRGI